MARNVSSISDGFQFVSFPNENEQVKSVESNDIVESKESVESVEPSNTVNVSQSVVPVQPAEQSVTPISTPGSKLTRKIGIELSEVNYCYLKDIARYNDDMQMKEYLNQLLDADRKANADLLPYLPLSRKFL